MRRLEGSEIPTTEMEFCLDESGRLIINIKGEDQNPVINYNDSSLTAARDVNSINRPVFSAGAGGQMGAGSWNSCGYSGGATGAGWGACDISSSGGSGGSSSLSHK